MVAHVYLCLRHWNLFSLGVWDWSSSIFFNDLYLCHKPYIKHTPGGRFKRKGTYVYLWLIHVDVWQKPTQYCKAIILQLKIIFFFKRTSKVCSQGVSGEGGPDTQALASRGGKNRLAVPFIEYCLTIHSISHRRCTMDNIHWVLNAESHSFISLFYIHWVHNVPWKSFLFNRHFDKIWELKVNTTDRALILMGLCSNDRKYFFS